MTLRGSRALRQAQGVGRHPAGPAVEGQANLVAEDGFHGFDAGNDVLEAALGHQALVGVGRMTLQLADEEVLDPVRHAAVKADAFLDDAEAFGSGFHLRHVGGIILGVGARHREAHAAVVDAHLVAHLAAQELVNRNPGGFAGNIPEGHFDGADGAAPGLEAPQAADALHDPLDVGGIFVDQVLLVVQDVGL